MRCWLGAFVLWTFQAVTLEQTLTKETQNPLDRELAELGCSRKFLGNRIFTQFTCLLPVGRPTLIVLTVNDVFIEISCQVAAVAKEPAVHLVVSGDFRLRTPVTVEMAGWHSSSRRTIVVLSQDFFQSTWGKMEFRAAHGLERVILLLRGDVLSAARADPELRVYLNTNTYVHEDDLLVWDRVRYAVLRSRRPRSPVTLALPATPAVPNAFPVAPPALTLSNGPIN